jgi:prepilin-type N-terminal cleavage/methylation domain-containing protein
MIFGKKHSAGFSLMEIMIAVAIIGTMAVLIMPNLTKYLGRAKSSATINITFGAVD